MDWRCDVSPFKHGIHACSTPTPLFILPCCNRTPHLPRAPCYAFSLNPIGGLAGTSRRKGCYLYPRWSYFAGHLPTTGHTLQPLVRDADRYGWPMPRTCRSIRPSQPGGPLRMLFIIALFCCAFIAALVCA